MWRENSGLEPGLPDAAGFCELDGAAPVPALAERVDVLGLVEKTGASMFQGFGAFAMYQQSRASVGYPRCLLFTILMNIWVQGLVQKLRGSMLPCLGHAADLSCQESSLHSASS